MKSRRAKVAGSRFHLHPDKNMGNRSIDIITGALSERQKLQSYLYPYKASYDFASDDWAVAIKQAQYQLGLCFEIFEINLNKVSFLLIVITRLCDHKLELHHWDNSNECLHDVLHTEITSKVLVDRELNKALFAFSQWIKCWVSSISVLAQSKTVWELHWCNYCNLH